MSYSSDWTQPAKLGASCSPAAFWCKLKPTKGDFSCLCSLFFDNLSTLVTVCGIFQFVVGGAATVVDPTNSTLTVPDIGGAGAILSGRIIPACGIMLFIGNCWYSWMATRMATQFGRDFTAQPYGINTVGCFPFLFNIMLPIAITTGSIETAWKAGCAGNFLVGLIDVCLGIALSIPFICNLLLKTVPIHALTIPVAGVGITWLSINQIAPCFGTPVAGFIPMAMIFYMYYSKVPISVMGYTIPEVLHWIVPGYVLGWIYQLPAAAAPGYSYQHPGAGLWIGGAAFEGLADVGPYFGTVLPIAIAACAGDLMSLVSAFNAGDPYPIGETLITDGLFTIIGSIFGSPFGSVVYFGHPVHKKLGGKYFFSFANGLIYLVLTLSGIFPLILDITPKVAAGPTIFIFGLMLCEECTRSIPQRHHSIIFFVLFFAWCDYFGDKGGSAAGGEEGAGLNLMKSSALLNAMLWATILCYALDRKWVSAAIACVVAAILTVFGFLHAGVIDMTAFMTGFQVNPDGKPRYSTSPFQTAMAYIILAACNMMYFGLKKAFPDSYPDTITEIKDEQDDAALNSKLIVIGSVENWWAKGAGEGEISSSKTESASA